MSLSENSFSSKSAVTKFPAEPSNRFFIRLFTCVFFANMIISIGDVDHDEKAILKRDKYGNRNKIYDSG